MKRKLFTPDKSTQKQDINDDLVTLYDLINVPEKCQKPGTSLDIHSEFDNNGTIYLLNEIFSDDNTNIQQSDGALLQVKSKKRLKQVDKWKEVASKIARLKGSPYRSTVAKNKVVVEGQCLKPPCACRDKCSEKIPYEKRLHIFNEFWKHA